MATGSNDDLQAHLIPNLEGLDQRIEIGRGAYGAVYEVKLNGLPCIAKGLHQILLGIGGYERVGKKEVETIRAKFLQECSLLSKLKHPNIVQFLGIHRTKEDVLLVMEYMHMDLAKCLDTHPDIPLPLKLSILLDVSYGLRHLHSQTPLIIHRDLTAANVLLTEGLRAKIADLGVSKIFDIQQIQRAAHTAAPGTQAYMPPEALNPTPQYDTKLDVFSFGVLSLHTANQAFPSVHEPPLTTTIIRNREVQIFKRKHWIDKMGVDHPLYPLVMQCLQDCPDQRLSAKELCGFLSGLCMQHSMKRRTILEVEKERDEAIEKCNDLEKQLQNFKKETAQLRDELSFDRQQPWKEIMQLRDELSVVRQQYEKERRECEKLRAQLVAEKGLREQIDGMLALQVANNMEESEAKGGLFGRLRALTGLTTVHKLELSQDLAQRKDADLKQLTKIQQLTKENEQLQHELDLLKCNAHQEDPQSHLTHQLRMENEQLKREQHSNGAHMMHTGTQSTNQSYLPINDREWPTCNMTAPVESSFYQQRGNPHPPPQPFLAREQPPPWAHLGQGQHQFQFQSPPPPPHQSSSYVEVGGFRRALSSDASRARDGLGVPVEVPFDPNLTCPHCGRQFRKGCIQSFREHASSCR